MNKLIHQFNLKGELWSFSHPYYLKNFFDENEKNFTNKTKSIEINTREWYFELSEENHQFNNVELEKLKEIKTKQPRLIVWINSKNLNLLKREFIEIADFIVVKCSSEAISEMGKINFYNIPIGIPLVLSKSFLENKENDLFALFDELLLIVNSWRYLGVKDIFIDIDFSDSLNELKLFPLLRNLNILKYLNIPITARIPFLDSSVYYVGLEMVIESIFDLGGVLIRSNDSDKISQMVSLRKKRFSLENGK